MNNARSLSFPALTKLGVSIELLAKVFEFLTRILIPFQLNFHTKMRFKANYERLLINFFENLNNSALAHE